MKKLCAILLLCFPLTTFAWGVLGHRVIAEVAEKHLTSKTRAKLKTILGSQSIAMASNWADFIKSDSTYDYLSPWHYNNFPPGLNKEAFDRFLKTDTVKGAFRAENFLKQELMKPGISKHTEQMYLKLLIHFVGDIHQPLHMGRKEDLGGNRIRVMWSNENVNLHQVWDERLVNFQQLSYTEYEKAINHATREEKRTWSAAPLEQWLYESYQCAEKIYAGIAPEQKLGYRYNFDYVEMMNEQLLKGGIRLAALLNEIYGK